MGCGLATEMLPTDQAHVSSVDSKISQREKGHTHWNRALPDSPPPRLPDCLRPRLSIESSMHSVKHSPISHFIGQVDQEVMGDFCPTTSVLPVSSRHRGCQDSASSCPGDLGTTLCFSSWYQAFEMFSCCFGEKPASWGSPSEMQPGRS